MKRLLRAIRERLPETLLLAGGEHVTALPEFTLRECLALDMCALGEGEETLVDLVNRLDAGEDPCEAPGPQQTPLLKQNETPSLFREL